MLERSLEVLTAETGKLAGFGLTWFIQSTLVLLIGLTTTRLLCRLLISPAVTLAVAHSGVSD